MPAFWIINSQPQTCISAQCGTLSTLGCRHICLLRLNAMCALTCRQWKLCEYVHRHLTHTDFSMHIDSLIGSEIIVHSETSSGFFLREFLWCRAAEAFYILVNNIGVYLGKNIAVTFIWLWSQFSESGINNNRITGIQATLKKVFILRTPLSENINTLIKKYKINYLTKSNLIL